MEEHLQHFSHEHTLILVRLQQPNPNKKNSDEDESEDDFVIEDPHQHHVGNCKMCMEEIYSFHQYYFSCKDCDYSLHKFCAELPTTQQNHPLHPGHNLTLSIKKQFRDPGFIFVSKFFTCAICNIRRNMFYNYHCSICDFNMDIVCATVLQQKMDHPGHPHQLLQRHFSWMISQCNACGRRHSGTFYHCTTCSWYKIHLDCALLPTKLLIQQSTNGSFSHTHLLTLAYSFPPTERRAKFYPRCRVCDMGFNADRWHYRCNKCQYYVHVDCATSKRDAFLSSIFRPASKLNNIIQFFAKFEHNFINVTCEPGLGKTYKNFKDDDYPNLVRCPFRDESFSLLKHLFISKGEPIIKGKVDGDHVFNHQHPLILFDTQTSLLNGPVSLHDPVRKFELLCDGCVRPIMDLPFYKCSQNHCDFLLHEWCTRLPSEIQNHHHHPDHTLVLLPKFSENILGLFACDTCHLISSGFAYGCKECQYYVDVNCAFIPNVITHDAHPNHLLQRLKVSTTIKRYCKACRWLIDGWSDFHCSTCDFYMHAHCALLLPETIRHVYDKHSLSLRYSPAENHSGEYFCEICEEEFDPREWFYHCSKCDWSMHTTCAPLILQCEQSTYTNDHKPIFKFLNVKFGGTLKTMDHQHHLTVVQGLRVDGLCIVCDKILQYEVILKCFQCQFARHYLCVSAVSQKPAICDA